MLLRFLWPASHSLGLHSKALCVFWSLASVIWPPIDIMYCALAILLAFGLEYLASHSIRLCAFALPLAGQPFTWPPQQSSVCLLAAGLSHLASHRHNVLCLADSFGIIAINDKLDTNLLSNMLYTHLLKFSGYNHTNITAILLNYTLIHFNS